MDSWRPLLFSSVLEMVGFVGAELLGTNYEYSTTLFQFIKFYDLLGSHPVRLYNMNCGPWRNLSSQVRISSVRITEHEHLSMKKHSRGKRAENSSKHGKDTPTPGGPSTAQENRRGRHLSQSRLESCKEPSSGPRSDEQIMSVFLSHAPDKNESMNRLLDQVVHDLSKPLGDPSSRKRSSRSTRSGTF